MIKLLCYFTVLRLCCCAISIDIPELYLNGKQVAYRDTGDWYSDKKANKADVLTIKSTRKIEKIELEYEFSEKGLATCPLDNTTAVTYSNSGHDATFALFKNCPALEPYKNKRARKVWIRVWYSNNETFIAKLLFKNER